MKRHSDIDRRSLLLHRLVSGKLLGNPELLHGVRMALSRWREADLATPALKEWAELLEKLNPQEIAKFLRSRSPQATRLRQSSPFVNILSEQERNRVLQRYAAKPA